MSSAGNTPLVPRPSVFLSYASEDREAARALRDALAASGLEVWYDENELTGGDAWDQKIRRQIRDCDYFMPVISATTERRKEGYFRREWRIAVERTLDMADDVLFLLPVAIDETREVGARVPDKFLTVQWLRVPGGQGTPAFDALMRRLLAGDHHTTPRPPLVAHAPAFSTPTAGPKKDAPSENEHAPPAMPAFPHAPEKSGVGHWIKYGAEVLWWVLSAAWLLFMRLPKWVRWLVGIWILITLLGPCRSNSNAKKRDHEPSPAPENAQIDKAAEATAEQIAAAIKSATSEGKGSDRFVRIAADLAQRFGQTGAGVGAAATGKPLVLVPFARETDDAAAAQFAGLVFMSCSERLLAARPADIGIVAAPEKTGTGDPLVAAGQSLGAKFVLGARITTNEGAATLAVRLVRIDDGSTTWSENFATAGADASAVAQKIVDHALASLPPKP